MTVRMAAGQHRKRLTSSNICEQYKGKKKKKLDSSDYVLNLKRHINLEWSNSQKRIVAKREQVGIRWLDMAPFVSSVSQLQSGLADVISVPQEIFGLENLTEVLSYEVWNTCLSESERELLTQFLPSGSIPEQTVCSLLIGENHHFGNSFLKWSSSLCSGNLHPDAALRVEKQFEADKKAYYVELNKYHNDMLEVLKQWKDMWRSCEDPEKLSKALTKPKQGSSQNSAERAKVDSVSEEEIPRKLSILYGDGTKYMSFIKISRKQHELVKSMKHSGDGIQSKSLSRMLGDIKNFNIQPYEAFEGEEKKRLHEHWLQLASKDVPVAFVNRRNRTLQREQWSKSLEQELAEKMKLNHHKDMDTENFESFIHKQLKGREPEDLSVTTVADQDEDALKVDTTQVHHLERIPSDNRLHEISSIGLDQEAVVKDILEPTNSYFGRSNPAVNMDREADSEDRVKPTDDLFVKTSLETYQEAVDQHVLKSAIDFHGRANPAEGVMELNASISTSKEMWQSLGTRDSYHRTIAESHKYAPSDLCIRQQQTIKDQQTPVIDLETNILEQHQGESIVTLGEHLENRASSFSPYANQDRNEVLPTLSKRPEMLSSYLHNRFNGSKQSGIHFLMANGNLPESGQFPNLFQDEQQLLEQRQAREKKMYMHRMMNENMHTSNQYPRQGGFSSIEEQSPVLLQSSANSGSKAHKWFAGEYRACNGWPQSSHQLSNNGGQCLGGGSADGSLYSVLSACKVMAPCSSYDIASSDEFMPMQNSVGGGIPTNGTIYTYAPNELTGSNSHDVAAVPPSLKADNVSWLHLPHQNHGLRDLAGKQFPRP